MKVPIYFLIFYLLLLSMAVPAWSQTKSVDAAIIWKTINGTNLPPDSPTIKAMQKKIDEGQTLEAAKLAVRAPESSVGLNIIKPIFTPMAGREVSDTEVIGDFTFAWIGGILHEQKIKDFFTGSPLYIAHQSPEYRRQIGAYRDIGVSLFSDQEIRNFLTNENGGQKTIKSYVYANLPETHNLGVITTSQYGKAIFEGGTNRRPVKKILEDFLCIENIESIMNFQINDEWVGRDIPRTPGNNPKDYLNRCVGCHAGMDSARGAFAYYDFEETIVFRPTPFAKMNINFETFESGRETYDESWEHTGWIPTHPDKVGQHFNGPKSFVELVTNSLQFYQCLVKRTHSTMCPQAPLSEPEMGQIAYQLKKKQNFLDMIAELNSQICLEDL